MVKITKNMDIMSKGGAVKSTQASAVKKFSWSRLLITVFLVFLTAGATAGTVWYFMDQANTTNKKTIDDLQAQMNKISDDQKKANEEAEKNKVAESMLYQNDDYGFEITFPEGWEKYKVNKKSPSVAEDGTVLAYYYIGLPTTDKVWEEPGMPSGYWSVFALSVYTKSQWNELSLQEGPKPALVAQKGDYVIGWMGSQAAPSDVTEANAPTDDVIKQIVDSIKFTN